MVVLRLVGGGAGVGRILFKVVDQPPDRLLVIFVLLALNDDLELS